MVEAEPLLKPVMLPGGLMTPQQAAEYLALALATVYAWAETGRLASVRLGRRLRFRREDLDAFILANRREARPA